MLVCTSVACSCLQYDVLGQWWLEVWDVISVMIDSDNLFQQWRFKQLEFINVNKIVDYELRRKVQMLCIGANYFQNSVRTITRRVQLVMVLSLEALFIQ